jgi:hypothetical protein
MRLCSSSPGDNYVTGEKLTNIKLPYFFKYSTPYNKDSNFYKMGTEIHANFVELFEYAC